MKRLLAPARPDRQWPTHPRALAVNEVDVDGVTKLAVYLEDDDPMTAAQWAAHAAGWNPPGNGHPDVALKTALEAAGTVAQVKTAFLDWLGRRGTAG